VTNKVKVRGAKLNELWKEWIELHDELRNDKNLAKSLSAPFFSAAPQSKSPRRIMLVGKATRADFDSQDYRRALKKSVEEAIRERTKLNRDVINDAKKGPFWVYFRRLMKSCCRSESDMIIWSNVAKIGATASNPSGSLLERQSDLAVRTLKAELKEYKPALVVFVTGGNQELTGIINQSLGVSDYDWMKSEKSQDKRIRNNFGDVWWLTKPRIALWTRHPQGAKREQIDFWVEKAQELLTLTDR
jgi:hypothetical protein